MAPKIIWLRAEVKPHERRTPLIPKHAAELVHCKYIVVVERSVDRIFTDEEYLDAGCELVDPGSWPNASPDAYILGIKELPHSEEPLKHQHIYFAHAYKNQQGAEQLLNRFKSGKGLLYDLEFLKKDKQRVTCFSYWAGIAGCAVTLLLWIQKCKHNNKPLKIPVFYPDESTLIKTLEQELKKVDKPSSLVVGTPGKCAHGVINFLKKFNLNATSWCWTDTKSTTSYPEIFQHNLLFNCIYITEKIIPFITKKQLSTKGNLSIVADISCDPNGPYNPLPIYDKITTFKNPTVRVSNSPQSIDVMAIDHLPSFLPKESSCDFSGQLLPYLQQLLKTGPKSSPWEHAASLFESIIKR
jgi:saccharopine dehydrogenase (NAD+, L-lysine forming)